MLRRVIRAQLLASALIAVPATALAQASELAVFSLRVAGAPLGFEAGQFVRIALDLRPGEEVVFETEVRRPPGPSWLWIEPHLCGGRGLSKYGGPHWERHL